MPLFTSLNRRGLFAGLILLSSLIPMLHGQTFGKWEDLEYMVENGEIEITQYTGFAENLAIPAEIEGLPVRSIGHSAMRNKPSLVSVNLPEGLESIGTVAFTACESLTSINIPSTVMSIGDWAFSGCTSLTSLHIPAGVSSIGSGILSESTSIEGITVAAENPHYEGIDGVLFDEAIETLLAHPATRTGSYSIPGSVKTIEAGAFLGSQLSNVIIPDGVRSIGNIAFYNCLNFNTVVLPDTITTIGESAFAYCSNLTEIQIRDGVEVIGQSAFAFCSNLKQISLPSSLATIELSTFHACSNLTEITLAAGLVEIKTYAFRESGLVRLNIPATTKIIELYAFRDCLDIEAIIVDSENPYLESQDGILFNESMSELILFPKTFKGEYTIPETVTTVQTAAFYNCPGLTQVTVPATTSLGSRPFLYCSGLESIEVNPDNPYHTSVDGILFNKPMTKLVDFPSKHNGAYAIPESVSRVESLAFSDCIGLTSVHIPESVTDIRGPMFQGCPDLESFSGPGSRTYDIIDGVLYSNSISRLARVPPKFPGELVLPDSLTSLEPLALEGCSSLTSIHVPYRVGTFPPNTFGDCTSLTSVFIEGSPPLTFEYEVFATPYPTVYYYSNAPVGEWEATFAGAPTTMLEWDEPWKNAVVHANGWIESSWHGWLQNYGDGWFYHAEHGWGLAEADSKTSIFLLDLTLDSWLWTAEGLYPYLYKYGQSAGWYWYLPGGAPGGRWFVRMADQTWVAEADLK